MKWREIARKALNSNGVIDGLTKIKIEELITKYRGVVSITGVTLVEYQDVSYPAFTFAEDPTRYFKSDGFAFRGMVDTLLKESDGDLSGVNKEWQAHPFKVKIEVVQSKKNPKFSYHRVEAIDDDDVVCDLETGEVKQPSDNPDPF